MADSFGGGADLELWGGTECTVNRVGDNFFEQLHRTGHHDRLDDLDLFAALGIRALRYPILWERTAPHGLAEADWTWPDARLRRLRKLGMRPIVGLLHHGHGPRDTSLIDPQFPEKFAEYARAVANRYPWVDAYTPINEPLTTARFCGLYGVWYPHGRDGATFTRILLAQCRATVLAMRAIREVNPDAQLIQNEDIGKVHSTPTLDYQAAYENERRWLTFDLLCGRLDESLPFWRHLMAHGATVEDLEWFRANPCPPDILGFDYYVTSERFLDHHVKRYSPDWLGSNGTHRYADLAAADMRAEGIDGPASLLRETWERYRLPIAVTEVHHGNTREEQLRWFLDFWRAATTVRDEGVDIRAVTAWALLGLYDWNTLVTSENGWYEPGVFDVRSPRPRPTAIARLIRTLAAGEDPDHPVLEVPGWWHRPQRLMHGFSVTRSGRMKANAEPAPSINRLVSSQVRPILVVGNGMLGEAFARVCERRGLPYRLLSRGQMDITRAEMVDTALREHNPWVVVNAAGFTGIDDAEVDENRCYAVNARGVSVLANDCARETVKLVTFSSDLVFDGSGSEPLTERSRVHPQTVFGSSKVKGERVAREAMPSALIVRTGPLFGPWDERNDLTRALRTLVARGHVRLAHDEIISPRYVPDLVNTTLDLLIDGECGIWHLANRGAVSPAVLVRKAASVAAITGSGVRGVPSRSLGYLAPREGYRVLGSERANLMPSLEDALGRYVAERGLMAHNLPVSFLERDLSITDERNDRAAVYL